MRSREGHPWGDETARSPRVTRRAFLGAGAALGAGVVGAPSSASIVRALRTRAAGSDIGAIEHVVFLMQENRSFDHYFGSYRGVRGFDDRPGGRLGPFAQPFAANTTRPPLGVQLPLHLSTADGQNARVKDLNHDWLAQHLSWNGGRMDGFVSAHQRADIDSPDYGLFTMGYYTRADLPFHYALADAYTIGDHYHCSVLGPTDPNRVMMVSGTIDPAGRHGGPVITTSAGPQTNFTLDWVTVPELLQDRGVTWKTYTAPGQGYSAGDSGAVAGDAILQYFQAYQDPSTPLYANAFTPAYPADFIHDVASNALPAVSWIIPPVGYDEHPPLSANTGAWLIDQVLRTLAANPTVWSKTVLFITWDENDGYFDHVPPPTPPPGTPGEYLTQRPLSGAAQSVAGPVGLGFRVPLLVVSPFSAGGWVCSEVFDHTSQIRFLEERFAIRCPNISAWRRSVTGDLTSTLAATSGTRLPSLPTTTSWSSQVGTTVGTSPPLPAGPGVLSLPPRQSMPRQESGSARRVPVVGGPVWVNLGPFPEGSATVTSALRAQVGALVDALVVNGDRRVTLTGFSDDRPSPARAAALSRARAGAVAALVRSGLSRRGRSDLAVVTAARGLGEPLASNATAAGRALNRRVLAQGS